MARLKAWRTWDVATKPLGGRLPDKEAKLERLGNGPRLPEITKARKEGGACGGKISTLFSPSMNKTLSSAKTCGDVGIRVTWRRKSGGTGERWRIKDRPSKDGDRLSGEMPETMLN